MTYDMPDDSGTRTWRSNDTAFARSERRRQVEFHRSSPALSGAARLHGAYPGIPTRGSRPFLLPLDAAAENLFPGTREWCLRYFADRRVAWHDAIVGGPSNHLMDSQVCCVNFLSPFAQDCDSLLALLALVFPQAVEFVPIAEGEPLVAFEWIGKGDYLNEWPKAAPPVRGSMVTSADAAVRYRDSAGRSHLVLMEWKYTEAYPPSEDPAADDKLSGRKGAVRLGRYQSLLQDRRSPIDLARVHFEDVFFEPVYQLMRQQLLAWQIEAEEEDVDVCSVLHIGPACNRDIQTITPQRLRERHQGGELLAIWPTLLRTPTDGLPRFVSVKAGDLFRESLADRQPRLRPWWEYVADRYSGVLAPHDDKPE